MIERKNIFGLILFGAILLLFIVGGYFFMDYMLNDYQEKPKEENESITELKEIRLDSTKEYIYFENSEEFLPEEEIYKEDVIINIKGFENINEELKAEMQNFYQDVTYIKDIELPEDAICTNNEKGIYSFSNREYATNEYDNYISLVITDYDYNCVDGNVAQNIKSYVISKEDGKQITEEKLLEKFKVSENLIFEKIEERLNDTQVLDQDEQIIDISGTLENIKTQEYGTIKALSIDKNGNLMINFIVKSNKINYNDSIRLN